MSEQDSSNNTEDTTKYNIEETQARGNQVAPETGGMYSQYSGKHDPYAQYHQGYPYQQQGAPYDQYQQGPYGDPYGQQQNYGYNDYANNNNQYDYQQQPPQDQYADSYYQAPPVTNNFFEITEEDKDIVYKPSQEQKEKLKQKLRTKFRHLMPFDWLGQKDFHWYSSWMLQQEHFVAFRVGLTLFIANCWWKVVSVFMGYTWTGILEAFLDSTSFLRYSYAIFALTGLLIGIGGSTLLSLAKLYMNPKHFKLLCQYKSGKMLTGKLRSKAIFTINHFYDAGMIFAVAPVILAAVPESLLLTKVCLSPWNTFVLPLLVFMDLWMTKRCRYDSFFIQRHLPVFTFLLFMIGQVWSTICMFLRQAVGVDYTEVHVKMETRYYVFGLDVSGFFPAITLNILLLLVFRIIDTLGVEWLYNFHRFKANYLLKYHINDISIKDVDDLAKSQQRHYKKKLDKLEAFAAEDYAKLAETVNGVHQYIAPGGYDNGYYGGYNGYYTEQTEPVFEPEFQEEEEDTGAGVSFSSLKTKSPKVAVAHKPQESEEIIDEKENMPTEPIEPEIENFDFNDSE